MGWEINQRNRRKIDKPQGEKKRKKENKNREINQLEKKMRSKDHKKKKIY